MIHDAKMGGKVTRDLVIPNVAQPVKTQQHLAGTHHSWLVRWLRRLLGVTADMAAGTMFEALTVSNLQQSYKLIRKLRVDVSLLTQALSAEAIQREQLERRVKYYEKNVETIAYHKRALDRVIAAEVALAELPVVTDVPAPDPDQAEIPFNEQGVRADIESTPVESEGQRVSKGFSAMAGDIDGEETPE
jgi:hypothetical protein